MNAPATLSREQLKALHALSHQFAPRFLDVTGGDAGDGAARAARLAWASGIVGHELTSFSELRFSEAARLISTMKAALGQEDVPPHRSRRRRPSRDQALAYGTAGRCGQVSNQIQMADAPTLELLGRLREQVGWTPERLGEFLHSKHSPVRSGAIRTLAEANRVIWTLRSLLRRRNRSASRMAARA